MCLLFLHQLTPLHVAAKKSRAQILQYLVGKGADINIKDKNGVNISFVLALFLDSGERAMFINIDGVCEPSKLKVFYSILSNPTSAFKIRSLW